MYIAFSTANSVDPDEMWLFAASHLGLPCLLMFHYIDTVKNCYLTKEHAK